MSGRDHGHDTQIQPQGRDAGDAADAALLWLFAAVAVLGVLVLVRSVSSGALLSDWPDSDNAPVAQITAAASE